MFQYGQSIVVQCPPLLLGRQQIMQRQRFQLLALRVLQRKKMDKRLFLFLRRNKKRNEAIGRGRTTWVCQKFQYRFEEIMNNRVTDYFSCRKAILE